MVSQAQTHKKSNGGKEIKKNEDKKWWQIERIVTKKTKVVNGKNIVANHKNKNGVRW